MKKIFVLLFTFALFNISFVVYANSYNVRRGEGAYSDDIIIEGSTTQNLTVTIVDAGSNISALSLTQIKCIDNIEVNSDGTFEFHWLPLNDGKFDIYISNMSKYEKTPNYYYFSTATKNTLRSQLANGADSDVINIMNDPENMIALDFDMDLINSISDKGNISKNFLAIRSGLSSEEKADIQKYVELAVIETQIQENPSAGLLSDLLDSLEKCEKPFSNRTFYNTHFNDTYKNYMCNVIKNNVRGKIDDLNQKLNDAMILAGVNCDSNWAALDKYISLLSYNNYDSYSKKAELNKRISAYIGNHKIETIISLKTLIDEYIVAINTEDITPISSGGSSGGAVVGYQDSTGGQIIKPNDGTKIAFNDVSDRDWFYDAVNYLKWKGIVQGYLNNFNPNDNVTRAEFVIMLQKAFNTISGDEELDFDDVNENDWYYESLKVASSAGLISGFNNYFYPNNPITRQDMAVLCWRFAKDSGVVFAEEHNDFADSAAIDLYAKEAVSTMSGNGIISGIGNNRFEPKGNATRAQAAQVIYMILSSNE